MSATPDEHRRHRRPLLLISGIAAIILITAGLLTYLVLHSRSSLRQQAQLRQKESLSGDKVRTALVKRSGTERALLLTGETRPYNSVILYPRVSGYLDQLNVDVGDRVKAGQLLAHVESPEQEQAFNSARANAFNLRQIARRQTALWKRKLVSLQQMQQAVSRAKIAESEMRTQRVLLGYQNIVAPFDGIISNRFVDLGWLLQNSSASQNASQPLFTVSNTERLRLFFYVDQKDAPYVRVGDPIEIAVPAAAAFRSHPSSRVDMIAGELDSRTRTLLVETILPNPDQSIVAGSYVQVQMKVATPSFLELPVQALTMRGNDAYVPVVGPGGKVNYAKIDVAENDGERILIRSGLSEGETVALNVGNSLTEGQKVQPIHEEEIAPSPRMAGTSGTQKSTELANMSQAQVQNQLLQQPQPSPSGSPNPSQGSPSPLGSSKGGP